MPNFLAEQFEDPARGIVGRLRLPPSDKKDEQEKETTPEENKSKTGIRIFIDKPLPSAATNLKPPSKHGPTALTTLAPLGRRANAPSPVTKEYELSLQNAAPSTIVFSSNSTGDKDGVAVEGRVAYKCQARPKLDSLYQGITMARSTVANKSTRGVKRLDERERKRVERASLRPTDHGESSKQREERKRAKEIARSHLDVPDDTWREAVRVGVFKAFEDRAYYTADELARAIDERTTRIRPIIAEVCAYNKSGPFSGKYELKDEFKTESQRRQKAAELESHKQAQLELARKRKEERMERERQDGGPASKKQRLM